MASRQSLLFASHLTTGGLEHRYVVCLVIRTHVASAFPLPRYLVAVFVCKPLSRPLFTSAHLVGILLGVRQIPGVVALPTSQVAHFLHVVI